MSSDAGSAPLPRPRPLAELALESLAARAEELARRWTIALIGARPFAALSEIPLERLAHDAPALCAQAVRALQSDVELDRLTGAGRPSGREQSSPAPRLPAIAGAHDPVAIAQAVEALRQALWQALLAELRGPALERSLPELGDRLAHVCAEVLAVALGEGETLAEPARTHDEMRDPGAGAAGGVGHPAGGRPAAVIVDERPVVAPAGGGEPVAGEHRRPHQEGPARAAAVIAPPRAWAAAAPDDPPELEIEIRDERRDSGPAPWISSIRRQLDRYEQEGQPFAVLLLEPLEIERLRSTESSAELSQLAGSVERALVRELGMAAPAAGGGRGAAFGAASLTRQQPGRHWLLVAANERAAVEALAQRMADAVAAAVHHRGAPLAVVVGTALCPEDGREAAPLAAHADVGLYAARAAARAAGSAGGGLGL